MSNPSVGFYSPYFPDQFGGGERYLLSIAETLSESYRVIMLVHPEKLELAKKNLPIYEKRFGLKLSGISLSPTGLGKVRSPLSSVAQTVKFDMFFAMTDGSIFPTGCKNSYFIVQLPWTRQLSLVEKLKLKTWKRILVYSDFVKEILSKSWETDKVKVLEPYVDTMEFVPDTKENIILSVGRFFAHSSSNSKRQDVLIEAFRKFHLQDKTGYTLVLSGSLDPGPETRSYVAELKAAAQGLPINIQSNLSFSELKSLYGRARFYWHAAGFEVDEKLHPENTEHFGITTLEAMSSGAIPIVVPKGGQSEILKNDGQHWQTVDELVAKTMKLAILPKVKLSELSLEMRESATRYDKHKFVLQIKKLSAL